MSGNTRPAWPKVDRALLPPKALFFCFYAAMASLIPFMALYYRQVGLSGGQIGLLSAIGPLMSLIAAPAWGALADRTRRHQLLLSLAIAGAMVVMFLVSQVGSLALLALLVTAYAWFSAPIMPLVDSSVLALLGDRKAEYGKQRMWGAVGWGIAAAIAGGMIDRFGLAAGFTGFLAFMSIMLVASRYLQISEAGISGQFWGGFSLIASNPAWVTFLLTVFVVGIGAGVTNHFLLLYLSDLGASETMMGWSLVVATLSEIPLFFFSHRLLQRWGALGVLMIALGANIIRLAAFAVMPGAWAVLPINLLHGFAFSAMWAAGVTYAGDLAPAGMGATAQGLFSGVNMGLGAATGALVGGLLYDLAGPRVMFGVIAVAIAAAMAVFWLAENGRARRAAASLAQRTNGAEIR